MLKLNANGVGVFGDCVEQHTTSELYLRDDSYHMRIHIKELGIWNGSR